MVILNVKPHKTNLLICEKRIKGKVNSRTKINSGKVMQISLYEGTRFQTSKQKNLAALITCFRFRVKKNIGVKMLWHLPPPLKKATDSRCGRGPLQRRADGTV